MKELQEVLAAALDARRACGSAVLATVVETSGSTYRRAGARMLLTGDGWAAGSISGGCLEGDLLRKAWWRTEGGVSSLVTYDSTSEDDVVWGFGLGCHGVVRVLLERLPADDKTNYLDFLRDCLSGQKTGVLATVYQVTGGNCAVRPGDRLCISGPPHPPLMGRRGEGDISDAPFTARLVADAQSVLAENRSRNIVYPLSAGGEARVFLETIAPPLPLVIFGAGHDAVPLVRLAKEQMGWNVTLVDHRAAWATPQRFPGADSRVVCSPDEAARRVPLTPRTAALVMTHQFPCDVTLIRQLLRSPAGYIGLLGPRRRTERLLSELAEEGFVPTREQRARLHGPVGLDIGADSPEQIALSIVAEIQAVTAGRSGGLLREQPGAIHARPENHAAEEYSRAAEIRPAEKIVCLLASGR